MAASHDQVSQLVGAPVAAPVTRNVLEPVLSGSRIGAVQASFAHGKTLPAPPAASGQAAKAPATVFASETAGLATEEADAGTGSGDGVARAETHRGSDAALNAVSAIALRGLASRPAAVQHAGGAARLALATAETGENSGHSHAKRPETRNSGEGAQEHRGPFTQAAPAVAAAGAITDLILKGTPDDDVLAGGDGDDEIRGEAGDDTLSGNGGDDRLEGGAGDDRLEGGVGDDTLIGGAGDDTLIGGADHDRLEGGEGNDTLVAGAGDVALGGAGDDRIEISTDGGIPFVIDGGEGSDTLQLEGAGAGSLARARVQNVERLVVKSGSWNLGDASVYSDITVKSGGSVVSSIAIGQGNRLTVEAGGAVTASAPVVWSGGDAAIGNAGRIEGERAIDTGKSAVDGTLTITNRAGGAILGSDDAIRIQSLGGSASGAVVIDNAGTIRSETGEALDLKKSDSAKASFTITNRADGVIESRGSEAIKFGHGTTLHNDGLILGGTRDDKQSGVNIGKDAGGKLLNHGGGLISGGHHGVTGDAAATIVNDGVILGQNGSGINLDTGSSSTTVITNSGTIAGQARSGDGDGIDVDGLLFLTNSGTIKAIGRTANGSNEALAIGGGLIRNLASGLIHSDERAIQVDDSNGGSAFAAVTIENAGTIKGAGGEAIRILGDFADSVSNSGSIIGSVSMAGGNDTLTNSGTITGAVDMGSGDDEVTIDATGTIDGALSLGAGDDTLRLAVGSSVTGAIDGGAGQDTVVLTGSGEGALAETSAIEALVVAGGTWTLDGRGAGFSSVTVKAGAAIAEGLIVDASDHVTVEKDGAIIGADAAAMVWSGMANGAVIDNAGRIGVDSPWSWIEKPAFTNSDQFGAPAGKGSLTLNNLAGGKLGVVSIKGDLGQGGSFTLNNAGTITRATPTTLIDIAKTGAAAIKLANAGSILGGGNATLISLDGTSAAEIENSGSIRQSDDTGAGADATAIDLHASQGTKITNKAGGLIEGARHAISGTGPVSIANAAGATIAGRLSSAIALGDGDDSVTNDGTIKSARGVAIALGGGNDTLTNSGSIAADVDLGAGDDTVTNAGTITGGLALGAGRNTLRNSGSIGGSVSFGDGDDRVTLVAGSRIGGDVDLGDGANTLSGVGRIGGDILAGSDDDQVYLGADSSVSGSISLGEGDNTLALAGRVGGDITTGEGDDVVTIAVDGAVEGGITLGGGMDSLTIAGTVSGDILTGEGDDMIQLARGGSAGHILAGDGADRLSNAGTISGSVLLGAGDDSLENTGSIAGPVMLGDGDDSLTSSGAIEGDVNAGDGSDRLVFRAGATVLGLINLGAGDDSLDAGAVTSDLTVDGGAGADRITTGAGNDSISAGSGDDIITAGAGDDVVKAGAGSDSIDGGAGHDVLDLTEATGAVTVDMRAGTASGAGIDGDRFTGIEEVRLGAFGGQVVGSDGDDTIKGGGGTSILSGGAGNDRLVGGTGVNTLNGGSGDDTLIGGDQGDTLSGGSGADLITGGSGHDRISGGSGSDTLNGGAGDDILTGGSGADNFVFAAGFGKDTVTDFTAQGPGHDVITFDHVFADFASAMRSATQVGSDTVFTIDDHTTLTLQNTQLSSLTADDFRFV